jgi:hypothetical protein
MSWWDWFTASPGAAPPPLGWGNDPAWDRASDNAFRAPNEFDKVREALPPDHPMAQPLKAGRAVDYNFVEGKGDRLDIQPNAEGVAPYSGWELEQPKLARHARLGKAVEYPSLIERINPSLQYEKDLNTTVAPKSVEPFSMTPLMPGVTAMEPQEQSREPYNLNPVVRGTVIDAEWEPMTGERRNAPSQLRRGLQALPEALKATNVAPMLGMLGEGALDSAARAITAPVRAMEGEIDPDDMFEEAWNTTLNVGGWGGVAQGTAAAAGKKLATGDLGIFAGQRAKTAPPHAKFAQAAEMEAAGEPRVKIWRDTGISRNPADRSRPRFEIDDSQMEMLPRPQFGFKQLDDGSFEVFGMAEGSPKYKAPDVLKAQEYADTAQRFGPIQRFIKHDKFFEAYPEAKDVRLYLDPEMKTDTASFSAKENLIRVGPQKNANIRDTVLHEMQHWVQNKEGFSPGMNTNAAASSFGYRARAVADKIDNNPSKFNPVAAELRDANRNLQQYVEERPDLKYQLYRREAGETEARNVEARSNYQPWQRAFEPPSFTQDVPYEKQWHSARKPLFNMNVGKDEAAAPLGFAADTPAAPKKLVPALRTPEGEIRYGKPGEAHYDVAMEHNLWPNASDQGFVVEGGGPWMSRADALDFAKANEPGTAANLNKARMGRLEANDLRRAREIDEGSYPKAPPLKGMPTTAEIPGFGSLAVGPNPTARAAAESYMKKAGMPYNPQREYVPVDPQRAARVADEFERMPHNPNDPEVATSYKALIDETKAQFDEMPKDLKIEFIKPGMKDPYAASPRLVQKDIAENNHMWVYPTESGFGKEGFDPKGNPMLERSGVTVDGRELANNDLFRIVHDYFGHAKEGVGFRATGEDNAFRQHRSMFSPAAQRALTTETRGQNSWLNYGPQGAKNRTAKTEDTTFADQKVGLMPQWTTLYANSKKAAPLGLAAALEKAPRNEALSAAEDAWRGGVADFGDPQAAIQAQAMPGYFDYRSGLEEAARANLGDSFDVYRYMPREQLEAWKRGDDIPPLGMSTSEDFARKFKNFAGFKGAADQERVLVKVKATPESIVMRGSPEERELVIDANMIEPSSSVTELFANSKKAAPLGAVPAASDFPFDNPNAKPVGKAVDDPMSYTNKGGMPLKSPQLPLGFTGSFDATKNAPFTMGGRHPHEWTPEEFEQVGKAFGVERLGPMSPEVEFPYLERGSFDIPGGLDGKFTYYDMLAMKTHPINPERIDPALHAQIQKKMTRSMMPDEGDVSQSHMLSGLNFGMTSPGNPLFSNQLAMSRLRVNSVEDLDRLANSVPWKFGDDVPKEMRHKYNVEIGKKYGIGAADADGGGGLGVRGNADYTRVAEMAQMFKKDPEWFRKRPDEQWSHFAERVFTQVPGLAAKTGSFGVVFQDPVKAAVSAIDRHMSKIFKDKFLDTPEKRIAWETRVMNLYNKKRAAKGEAPMQDISELSDNDLGYELLQELGKTKKANFRTPKGEIGKGVPEHMRDEKWIMEPKQATVMGTSYKKALQANADEASKAGLGLFESQWQLWDNIRRRLEPHENMFPGLEKLPRMSVDQLKRVDRTHMLSGHKDQTKVKLDDGGVRLKPTKLMENPADFAYFSNPAAAAPFGAIPAARRDERPQGRQ